MKTTVAFLAALLLAGCAGMVTAWDFQLRSIYQTPQEKPEQKAPERKEGL